MLLADLRTIFEAQDWPEAIASNEVLDKLTELEGRPWSDWRRGKPLTARGLSNLLKPFDVAPRQVKRDGNNLKRYLLSELQPHWDVYFPARRERWRKRRSLYRRAGLLAGEDVAIGANPGTG